MKRGEDQVGMYSKDEAEQQQPKRERQRKPKRARAGCQGEGGERTGNGF